MINLKSWSKFNKHLNTTALFQLALASYLLQCVASRHPSVFESKARPSGKNNASNMTAWHSFGKLQQSTKETFLKLKDTTSASGTGRSFLVTLCLLTFKVIKYACICSLFFLLFILLCPLLPLLIPVAFFLLLFFISLLPLFGANPPAPAIPTLPPVIPTTEEPPFTAIPARKPI